MTCCPQTRICHVFAKKCRVSFSFTRLRLSSHRLRIETGRWSRIPRENRLCACGVIQDEAHAIQVCPNVGHIRQRYDVLPTYPDFVIEASSSDHFKGNMQMISPDRTRFYCQILAYLNTIHLLYGTRCLSY